MPKPQFVYFTVEGQGEFPLDMLRYDACYPTSSVDASEMRNWDKGLRRVALTHRIVKDEVLHRYPTQGRWQSMGWRVVGVATDTGREVLDPQFPGGVATPPYWKG